MEPALLDNSAWQRLRSAGLSRDRTEEVASAMADDRIFACAPLLLEAGYSTRNLEEHATIIEELGSLPTLEIDGEVEAAAIFAQRELCSAGQHRLPPVDLLIAALADRNGVGVVHYDHDYDRILRSTHLSFESVWLTEPGAL
jgi:hypothetical protein